MLHEPEEYKRLRAELDTLFGRIGDDVYSKLTLEAVEDLEYVKMSY